MLQQDEPDYYVIGTGEADSVNEFLVEAFGYTGLAWQEYVKTDPRCFRHLEIELMLADATKVKVKLGWEPRVTFRELVRILVDADIATVGLESQGQETTVRAKHGLNPYNTDLHSTEP